MSATARTLDWLRKRGYHVAVVEKYAGGIKLDAFGFMDILAYRPDSPVNLAVQSTVGSHHAAHLRKYEKNPVVMKKIMDWIKNHQFFIISWRKAGPRGKRKLWTPRVEEITEKTFAEIRSHDDDCFLEDINC